MFSIKVVIKKERLFVGKSGKISVYKTRESAEKAANKIDKKYNPKVVRAIPVHEFKS